MCTTQPIDLFRAPFEDIVVSLASCEEPLLELTLLEALQFMFKHTQIRYYSTLVTVWFYVYVYLVYL